ncbi:unnamed protein product [Moneuplotes crassus]|uniref:Peptidase A1 domain-containing protein n=1 Tax=Euplotes crassus TaxID=5936 RepID=A0AAD1X835_EUPCR|nr:unnamed protein product [Moneuplotes crassus]
MKTALLLVALVALASCLRVDLETKKLPNEVLKAIEKDIIAGTYKTGTTKELLSQMDTSIPLTTDRDSLVNTENPAIDLTNFQDLQYYGPVTIGSEHEVFDVVYDTGSGWIWATGKGCSGCSANKHQFDPATSSTYESTGEERTLRYGKGEVTGDISVDQIGLPGVQANARFIPAMNGKDNDGMQSSGIVGLTPVVTDDEDLLVDKLFEQNVIDRREFTTYIGHESERSYIDFGENKEDQSGVTWIDLEFLETTDRQIYWSTDFDSVTINGEGVDLKYHSSIWDTGTSLIGFNPDDFKVVIDNLLADFKNPIQSQGLYMVKCSDPADIYSKSISFNFGGLEMEVPASEFIIEQKVLFTKYCIVGLMPINLPGVLLGDSFLRDTRIIHDMEGQRLGVFPRGNPAKLVKESS